MRSEERAEQRTGAGGRRCTPRSEAERGLPRTVRNVRSANVKRAPPTRKNVWREDLGGGIEYVTALWGNAHQHIATLIQHDKRLAFGPHHLPGAQVDLVFDRVADKAR